MITTALTCLTLLSYPQVTSTSTTTQDGLELTETVVQVSPDPLDFFVMHRVRDPNVVPDAIILLMNPLAQGFNTYLFDENGDLLESTAGYLADNGVEVWGYTPRGQDVAAGTCELSTDCSIYGSWGLQSILDDGDYIQKEIKSHHPMRKPAVGGLSLGGISGTALVDAKPGAWSGLFVWEGLLYTEDLGVRSINTTSCTDSEARLLLGDVYDPGPQGLQALAQGAKDDPNGPGHLAYVTALEDPPPTPVTKPTPTYKFARGDLANNQFIYASSARAIESVLQTFSDYVAVRQIRDVTCGLAGERAFSSNLGSFQGGVLAIGSEHGFGAHFSDLFDELANASIEFEFSPDYGHVDQFFSPDHLVLVEDPLLDWLIDLNM